MTRPPETPSPPEDAHPADTGEAWDAFLSESSEEWAAPTAPPEPLQASAVPEPEREESPAAVPVSGCPAPGVPSERDEALNLAPDPSALVPAVAIADTIETIRLDEIAARQVPVQWPEAVAAVEALCETLLDETGPATGVPESRDIYLTSAGEVIVSSESRRTGRTEQLSAILQTLLPVQSTPLALRLFVTSSMSSHRYGSIERYVEGLSHYAARQSSREDLIRTLCRRSLVYTPPPAVALPPKLAGEAPRRSRRPVLHEARPWAAAAVVILLLGGVALWMWETREAPASSAPPARAVLAATAAPDERRVPVAPPPTAPAVERERPQPPRPRAPRSERQVSPSGSSTPRPADSSRETPFVPPIQTQVLPPVPSDSPRLTAAGEAAPRLPPSPRTPEPAAAPPAAPIATSGVSVAPRIYSREDRDVEPPAPLLLMPPTPAGIADNVVNTLELIIDERGEVEMVYFVSRPPRLTDTQVLSPVKLMKFRPASKNGKAVPYRLQMTLTSPPK